MHLSKWWDSQKNHHRYHLQTIVIASSCRLQWRDVRNPSQSFKMLGVIREILGAHDKVEPELLLQLNFLLSWSSKFRLYFQKFCFPVCSSPIARLSRSLLQQPSKAIADTQPRFPVYSSNCVVLIVVFYFMEAAMLQSWHTSIRDVQELLPLSNPAWRNS